MYTVAMENVLNKILNDPQVIDRYQAIDKVNPYPFSHGMKHINNVIKLTDKMADAFDLNKKERLILQVSEALHDLGQTEGRENHGHTAAKFAKTYLRQFSDVFTPADIQTICSAFETHDCKDYSKLTSKFSYFVNLIDKLDFSASRLEDDCEKKFGYTVYQDIKDVDLDLKDNVFIINIRTIRHPKIITTELLYNYRGHFFNKVYYTAKAFCKHFGFTLKMQLEGKDFQLERFEEE